MLLFYIMEVNFMEPKKFQKIFVAKCDTNLSIYCTLD